jgi:hypothetical protein
LSELTVVVDFVSLEPPFDVVVVFVVSDLASLFVSPDVFASVPALPSFVGDAFAPLLRKSVTYQPEPFSWKPAAETFLESADA